MLFLQHYQSTPDCFGNFRLEPFRFGYSLNERYRLNFFKRAVKYFREGPFIMRNWHKNDIGVLTYTFESKRNGYYFKLVGKEDAFFLLQVNRATDNMWSGHWDTTCIRNYFGFLAFVLKETGAECDAELFVGLAC